MPHVVFPADLDDPRLDAYRDAATPPALTARGLFVAEGRLVVQRLVEAPGHRLHSLLLTDTAAQALAPTLASLDAATLQPCEHPAQTLSASLRNQTR